MGRIYRSMIAAKDFTSGTIILGFCFSMLMIYGMSGPFIIEHLLHYSAATTGNCSLVSGLSVCAGGLLSKTLIHKPFFKKLVTSVTIQIAGAVALALLTLQISNLYTLLAYVVVIHLLSGFIFNNMFSYCLMLFPQHAGKASGLTGGSFGIFAAVFSYGIVDIIDIKSQPLLAVGYTVPAIGVLLLLIFTRWNKQF
jgi:hypothetical protein